MIENCLAVGLIQESVIKFAVKASLSVPRDYFKGFIDMLYQNLPEKLAKFAVNSMMACFKLKDKDIWEHAIPPSTNFNNMFHLFLNQDGTNIFSRQIGKKNLPPRAQKGKAAERRKRMRVIRHDTGNRSH
jgi:hypothetical protein